MNIGESVTMNVGLQYQQREKKKRNRKTGGHLDLIWQCMERKIGIRAGWSSVSPGG